MLTGCDNVDVSKVSDSDIKRIADNVIVCDAPYIRHGVDCCLDKDSNSVCDKDERPVIVSESPTSPTPETTEPQIPINPALPQYDNVFIEESNHSIDDGEPTAKILVIAFIDYQCPFSAKFHSETEPQIINNYAETGKIRYSVRHNPLTTIHPEAQQAAEAAECAGEQYAFWPMHNKLFENQNALDVPSLKRYAAELNLDTARFSRCLDNHETTSIIENDLKDAKKVGLSGTPSVWIMNELVVGAHPYALFAEKIEEKMNSIANPSVPPVIPPAARAENAVVAGAHVIGDSNAKMTVIEFGDFQCPFCRRFFLQTEPQFIEEYVDTGKVRFAYRHFPLSSHQNAQISAEAAECAADQGQFWGYHDILFTRSDDDGVGLDVASLKGYAKELGLNTATFNSCLDDGTKSAFIQAEVTESSTAGVSGTPTFYINGNLYAGAHPYSTFRKIIEKELANS